MSPPLIATRENNNIHFPEQYQFENPTRVATNVPELGNIIPNSRSRRRSINFDVVRYAIIVIILLTVNEY